MSRQSKRARTTACTIETKAKFRWGEESPSSLKLEFERAADGWAVAGGLQKMISLASTASDACIRELPEYWSPLVGAILVVGPFTTRKGNSRPNLESLLVELVAICHRRGISVDGVFDNYDRPLVTAAEFGLEAVVRRLLEAGAKPDLADGHGRTALHAALQNPAGQSHVLRRCDRMTAEVLFSLGVVTPSLRAWRDAAPGSLIYVNGDYVRGSALRTAVTNKNVAAVDLLRQNGAVITDRDYLALRKGRAVSTRLLPVVSQLTGGSRSKCEVASWSPDINWSFPPTWTVAIALIENCGLPEAVFREHVIPFCSRDWFYTPEELSGPMPPLLGASMRGVRDMFARGEQWRDDA